MQPVKVYSAALKRLVNQKRTKQKANGTTKKKKRNWWGCTQTLIYLAIYPQLLAIFYCDYFTPSSSVDLRFLALVCFWLRVRSTVHSHWTIPWFVPFQVQNDGVWEDLVGFEQRRVAFNPPTNSSFSFLLPSSSFGSTVHRNPNLQYLLSYNFQIHYNGRTQLIYPQNVSCWWWTGGWACKLVS